MNYFDKIFVVSLDNEVGRRRMEILSDHFGEHEIEFERWDATENSNGVIGLLYSMKRLFLHCIKNEWTNVLVFEDDAVLKVGFWNFIKEVWDQVPSDYHCVKLGTNLLRKPIKYSSNLLQVKSSYATHAIVYSLEAMKLIVEAIDRNPYLAYDILLMKEIEPLNKVYCTYPQICFQRPGYSSIEKDFKDWESISAFSYNAYTKNL